jgi:hypothetical protein
MAITLEDATRARDPSSTHAFPEVKGEAKLTAPRTLGEELLARFLSGEAVAETSFEPGSSGGYARTITGTPTQVDRSPVSTTLDAGVPTPRGVFPDEGRTASTTGADPGLLRGRSDA